LKDFSQCSFEDKRQAQMNFISILFSICFSSVIWLTWSIEQANEWGSGTIHISFIFGSKCLPSVCSFVNTALENARDTSSAGPKSEGSWKRDLRVLISWRKKKKSTHFLYQICTRNYMYSHSGYMCAYINHIYETFPLEEIEEKKKEKCCGKVCHKLSARKKFVCWHRSACEWAR